MTTLLWIGTHLAAVALGHEARIVAERYRAKERERVLRALGGSLPDWEQAARKLEDAALDIAMRHGSHAANSLREQADITRKRGRRRDREWR